MPLSAALLALGAAGSVRAEDDATPPDRGALDPDTIRGVEIRGRRGDDVLRSIVDGTLYLPRLAVHGALYSSGFGIQATKDARIIARSRDLLLFLDRGGVYPRVALSSESFPALGATFFYRGTTLGTDLGGAYSNEDFWNASAHVSWQRTSGERTLKLTVAASAERLDNLVFHGIGARPRTDPRSAFLPGAPGSSGRYLQRRDDLNVVVGLRTGRDLEIFLDGLLRVRRPENPEEGDDRLGDVFDVSALPGAEEDGRQLYTELSARWDTRPHPGILSGGIRIQGYAGISNGLGADRSRLLRSGADLAAFLPVIRHDRVVVLRGTLDTVENLRDGIPLPFPEYPRHLTFRGVSSSRTILRTDEWVLVPSAAYQWPLSDNLGAQLFVDGLIVAKSAARLSTGGAPWAAGLALEIHTRHHGLGRLVVGGGSEGARIGVDLGGPVADNDRSRWR